MASEERFHPEGRQWPNRSSKLETVGPREMVKREVNKSIFQTNGELSCSCLRHTDLFAFHDAVSSDCSFKVVVGARNDFLLVVTTPQVLNQEDARLEQLYKAIMRDNSLRGPPRWLLRLELPSRRTTDHDVHLSQLFHQQLRLPWAGHPIHRQRTVQWAGQGNAWV